MPSTTSLMRAAVLAGVASAMPELAPRQMVTSSCADVHVFLGKGNNEPYPGRQGKLVSAICNGLSSCDYEDIQMHNMLEDNYCSAVTEGTTNGIAQIVAYNKRCPDSKLVVSGFSQGAQVVGDIFAGAGGTFFQGCVEPSIAALDRNSAAGKQIAAILTFGDVRHTANQPYGYLGGASKWGLFPRDSQQLANALNFAGVWRDYCNTEDTVCAGGNSVDEHLDYFDVYTNEAAGWVQGKVAAFQGPSPTGGSPAQTSAPAPTSMRSPYSNSTATDGASYVTTVTLDGGIVYTTVCPVTQTTVPNPTTVVPPPDHSATATCPSPLPEATHPATENLSAIPTTAAPTGPAGTGGVPVPPKTTPTGVATVSGSAANFVQVGLCAIVAGAAGFAALL